MNELFPGFSVRRSRTSGAEIHYQFGGNGPPLPLLHGCPPTHVIWHRIAPAPAQKYALVRSLPSGHYLAEEVPQETLGELATVFSVDTTTPLIREPA